MDKSWIELKKRFSLPYVRGCEEFLNFAFAHNKGGEYIYCPCKICLNRYYRNRCTVREHILVDGFSKDYKIWTNHGEGIGGVEYADEEEGHVVEDEMNDMVNDAFGWPQSNVDAFSSPSPDANYEKYVQLLKDAERELYPGCKNFTRLSFIVRLLQLKVMYGWSNTSFDKLMNLLKEAFPEGETLPASYYDAKKFRDSLGFNYIKYDACPNDCMLYWKDKKDAEQCDFCKEDRYKPRDPNTEKGNSNKKRIPRKQLRYFPVKERLQRLFMSAKTASLMRWHAEELAKDELQMHPANSVAWKKFDADHPSFAHDRRNVRLGLASDGFNPYRTLSSTYSIWPVLLVNFNLPPEECTKQSSMMLSLLIDGPKAPGNDIDVYLQPLIEDLKDMWIEGVPTYDADIKHTFQLRAALMWTINDFPAYANLSGWSTRGALACPSCNKDTDFLRLKYSRKFSYAGHRRFLPTSHALRKDSRNFVDKVETRAEPPRLSGEDVFRQVEDFVNDFGKYDRPNKKRSHGELEDDSDDLPKWPWNWKKRSIFFELPYWKYNMLRHNLDVMHIEKNAAVQATNAQFTTQLSQMKEMMLSLQGDRQCGSSQPRSPPIADDYVSPSHASAANSQSYVPTSNVSLSQRRVSPSQRDISPRHVSPSQRDISLSQRRVSPSQRDISPRHVSPSQRDISPSFVSPSQRDIPSNSPSQRHISPSNVSSSHRHISPSTATARGGVMQPSESQEEYVVLYSWNEPKVQVAVGKIISKDPNKMVDDIRVGEGNVEVLVESLIRPSFRLLYQRRDAVILHDALKKTVIWPISELRRSATRQSTN